MAIINKFTRTLPAPSATHSDGFVFLLSTGWFTQADQGAAGSPIDGGANSIANGGGDMKIFSSDGGGPSAQPTGQLPIEIISFVTGITPDAVVWVRTATYEPGDTICVGKDDTQTVQPPVTGTYGRNNVWQDYISSYQLLTDATDSSGQYDGVVVGASLQSGGGYEFTGSDRIELPDAVGDLMAPSSTITLWYENNNTTSNGQFIDTRSSNSDGYDFNIDGNNYQITVDTGSEVDVLIPAVADNNEHFVAYIYDGSSITLRYDNIMNTGVLTGEASRTTAVKLGNQANNKRPLGPGRTLKRVDIRSVGISSNKLLDEYTNQNSPDTFGTSSEWIDVSVGGIITTNYYNLMMG